MPQTKSPRPAIESRSGRGDSDDNVAWRYFANTYVKELSDKLKPDPVNVPA